MSREGAGFRVWALGVGRWVWGVRYTGVGVGCTLLETRAILSMQLTSTSSNFNRSPRVHYTPTLTVDFDIWNTFGGGDKNSLDLLWRQLRVPFQHASDNRCDDRGCEGRAIDVFVMFVDDVAFAQLDRDQLSQKRQPQSRRLIDVFIDALVLFHQRRQFFIGSCIELRVQFRLFRGWRVWQDGRGYPNSRRNHFRLLQAIGCRPVRRAIHAASRAIERVLIVQPADGDA